MLDTNVQDLAVPSVTRTTEAPSSREPLVPIAPFYSEPATERLRGARLLAVWVGLAAAAWAVFGGIGYGLYLVVENVL